MLRIPKHTRSEVNKIPIQAISINDTNLMSNDCEKGYVIKIGIMEPKEAKKNLFFWIPVKKNKIDVAPKSKLDNNIVTFQRAIRYILVVGQMFSLMPVEGIYSDMASDLKFKKKSWRYLYFVLSFLGQVFMTTMTFYKLYIDTSLKATTPVIFYGSSLITMIMFLRISKKWPTMVQQIEDSEVTDPNYDSTLGLKCKLTCFVVLALALFEHIMSLVSAFAAALVCYPDGNLYEGFVRHFYPWVFDYLPFSWVLGPLTQFFHFQSTFIWNFSDLFVIGMSYYLTSRLEQVNERLLVAQGKYLPEVFWRTTREHFGRITQLVRRVDDVISGIIFMSFANNMFFICFQLFNTLEDGIKGTGECSSRVQGATHHKQLLGGYESAVYFLFSLVYLISRSVAVSLIAAQVNTAANKPAPVLYDVPSPVYCVEVQRFLDQVNGDQVALSGLQFFSVTRGLLLTITGTIITYELVMVQFNSPGASNTTSIVDSFTTTPSV